MSKPPEDGWILRGSKPGLSEAKQIAGLVSTPALVEEQRLERRRIGRTEEDHRLARRTVDVLDPRPAGHGDGVELIPVVALAVGVRMALAAERRQQKARGFTLWQGPLAGTKHLRVETDGAEHRAAGHGIDVVDHDALVGIAIPVLVGVERRFHLLPA